MAVRSALPANWAQQVLEDLGISSSNEQSVQALHDIAESEVSDMVFNGSLDQGGAYNPFDSEGPLDGSSDYNSVGVQDYPSWAVGRQATVNLLKQENFSSVTDALRNNNGQGAIDAYNSIVAAWGAPGASYGAASPPGGYSPDAAGGPAVSGSGGGSPSSGGPNATLDSDTLTGAAQKIAGVLGDLADPLTGIFGTQGSFSDLFKILAWLTKPLDWLRVFCGIAGFLFAAGGVFALVGVV